MSEMKWDFMKNKKFISKIIAIWGARWRCSMTDKCEGCVKVSDLKIVKIHCENVEEVILCRNTF